MFNPGDFKVTDIGKIRDFIEDNELGIMFSVSGNGEYLASHVPFLVDDECKRLTGHIARENRQWEGLDGMTVLVVFQGPNHYISPTWYGEDKPVPTWNYAVVQAKGKIRIMSGGDAAMKILDDLTAINEEAVQNSWHPDWNDPKYRSMLSAIVPFYIDVEWIEGKWKFSQNHSMDAVRSVSDRMSELGSREASEVADIMVREKIEHDRLRRHEK